eukprot:TRINITY_DN1636_c0_g1_i1.p1 TRINITY_DN1636_c0_g1~~TRINITY_DN1636_c0_g1_i1.p1  ORF type:complete len:469 (+),score=181.15 TRINITY_DN1636_c0_g1_i1:99-1505(+)
MTMLRNGAAVVAASLANVALCGAGGWRGGGWWDCATAFGAALPLLWVYTQCAFGYPLVQAVYVALAAEGVYRGAAAGDHAGWLAAAAALLMFTAARLWWNGMYVTLASDGRYLHPDALAEAAAKKAAAPPAGALRAAVFGARPEPAADNHGLVRKPRPPAAAAERPRRFVVIVNPAAGSGNGAAAWKAAERVFCEAAVPPTTFVKHTTPDRKGTDIASTFTEENIDAVVTVGGDGTISEVLNGLLKRPAAGRPTLGIIPGGTCNNFARDLNLGCPAHAARQCLAGVPTPVDACKVHHNGSVTYSMNTIAWGVGLRAVQFADQLGFLGPAKFDVGGLLAILTFYPTPIVTEWTLQDDSTVSLCGEYVIAMSQLCQRAGNGFRFGPHAKLNDGLVDTCLLKHVGVLRTLELFDEVKRNGCHPEHHDTNYVQWKKVTFETAVPTPISVDGEDTGTTPMTAECVPGCFSVLV